MASVLQQWKQLREIINTEIHILNIGQCLVMTASVV
jgi:hypothetical protein